MRETRRNLNLEQGAYNIIRWEDEKIWWLINVDIDLISFMNEQVLHRRLSSRPPGIERSHQFTFQVLPYQLRQLNYLWSEHCTRSNVQRALSQLNANFDQMIIMGRISAYLLLETMIYTKYRFPGGQPEEKSTGVQRKFREHKHDT